MAKNDVVKHEKSNVGDQLPDFMTGYERDKDNFDSSDVTIPKIKLLQGLSKEIEDYEAAKSGEFWHTGLDMPLGKEFTFIVADRRKKYLLSAPISDGQGILARADDFKTWDRTGKWSVRLKNVKNPVTWEITDVDVDKSGLAKWGTYNPEDEDSPPAATLFYDYLVFLPGHLDLGPAVISLARTQIKKARKGLNDKIQLHGDAGRPMQGLVFKASSVEDSADGQEFKNWMFSSAGFVQDKELFDMAREYRGALANLSIKDEADEDAEPTPPSDDGEGSF